MKNREKAAYMGTFCKLLLVVHGPCMEYAWNDICIILNVL
jgi:hypothetical protein